MTKMHIVNEIAHKTGIEKYIVQVTIEQFMKSIKNALSQGEPVYLREFGTFQVKKRKAKLARNITKNTFLVVPAHYIPHFKPSKIFMERVKKNVKVDEDSEN
ncbi:MAG: integration host factor subunit beta [Bacteroidia bacterium]|nr:integration host factor subunit beta [Bacteroidia bacterium]